MSRLSAALAVMVVGACAQPVWCAQFADVLGYFEPGRNVASVDIGFGGFERDNPSAALGGPGVLVNTSRGEPTDIVSLGGWTDDPATGSGRTPALVVGFSSPVANIAGNDFRIVGNAPSFGFHEPGTVEVARESGGGGATTDGWTDETFYLLRPSNFDQINDPRAAPNDIPYATRTPGVFDFVYGPGPFADGNALSGYADVTFGGDEFEIDRAIDLNNNPVPLDDIAYVRVRTVTDSSIDFSSIDFGNGPLGIDFFSTEVDYLVALPGPQTSGLLVAGAVAALARARKRRRDAG